MIPTSAIKSVINVDEIDQNQNEIIKSNNRIKSIILKIIDIILVLFVFTPLITVYCVSIWDFVYVNIFPHHDIFQFISTLLFSSLIILVNYFFNHIFNDYHNKYLLKPSRKFYYGRDFWIRTIYTYIVGLAYILNDKSYYDIYDAYTKDVHWSLMFLISLFSFYGYRFSFQRSLNLFTKTAPCFWIIDEDLTGYFLTSKRVYLEKEKVIMNIH